MKNVCVEYYEVYNYFIIIHGIIILYIRRAIRLKYLLFGILLTLLFFSSLPAEYYSIRPEPTSLDIGDIDLDGDYDIIIQHKVTSIDTNYENGITILYNDGYGGFNDSIELNIPDVAGASTNVIKITNIDANPIPDIVTMSFTIDSIVTRYLAIIKNFTPDNWTMENLYSLNYDTLDSYHYTNLFNFDFDGDSDQDIVITARNQITLNDSILVFQNVNGSLVPFANYWAIPALVKSANVGDINNDGYDDIVIGSNSDPPHYGIAYLGSPDGLIFHGDIPNIHSKVDLFDMDQDGDLEINCMNRLTAQYSGYRQIWRWNNDGLLNFSLHTLIEEYMYYRFIQAGNFNSNGPGWVFDYGYYPDDSVAVYLNNGLDSAVYDQKYYAVMPDGMYTTNGAVFDFQIEDINGDGFDDIVTLIDHTMTTRGGVRTIFNDGTGHFLDIPNLEVSHDNYTDPTQIQINAFPNPFNNETNIQYSCGYDVSGSLNLFDLLGRKILTKKLLSNSGTIILESKELISGIYFIELVSNHQRKVTKIVVLK